MKDCWEGKRHLGPLHTHLNAPEDAVGVYPVLGTTEDGSGVVITIVPRAVAANTKKGEQDSGWFTGTLWKRTSAAEGMFFKSSWDDMVGFCLPPLGLLWQQGSVKGGVAQSSGHPHTQILKGTPPGSMPLSNKQGKVTVQDFIRSKLFTIKTGLTAVNISGMSRCLKFHIECKEFLSAPHDSVFTR